MIANQSEQHKRIYKLDQVQKQINQGWLSAGGRLLEDVPSDDGHAEILRRQIDAIKQQSRSAIDKAQKVIIAEHNYQGQLASIIKMNVNSQDKLVNQTKYDGTPFLPHEIEDKGLEVAKELKELV